MKPNAPALVEVLPHGPEAIVLDRVLAWDDVSVTCEATWDPAGVASRADDALRIRAIEWMAQAVGALAGIQARAAGSPVEVGFLIGAREVVFAEGLPVETGPWTVRARSLWNTDALGSFECSVERGETVFVRATLSVYRGALPPGEER